MDLLVLLDIHERDGGIASRNIPLRNTIEDCTVQTKQELYRFVADISTGSLGTGCMVVYVLTF